ncbi:MAG: anthranilate phosphoribosyltransferase [Candidatus Manganitrophus sp. SB1]|nr:anthranilate phosphoribosyltransferase [Candidatus Manganitrophus morganii]
MVHKVGAGEKAAQDLTYEEAREAAQLLLSGEATPAQAGGLLIAMRVKNETNEEMRAFTEVCRDYNKPLMLKRGVVPLDIPVYAGKKIFFHAIIPAAFLIAASGRPVLLHGFSGAPGRLGAADVLRSLGICVDFTPQEGSTILERQGFLYLDVAKFNPPLHRFQLLRTELGVRTLFNAVCRMVDPADSGRHLIGISHPPYFEKTLEVLKRHGSRRTLIVRGVEGGPEPSITSETKGFLAINGEAAALSIAAAELGLSWAKRSDIPGGEPEEQAGLIEKILAGEKVGPVREWVLLTAATGLLAAGEAPTLVDGWKRAEQVLNEGAGLRKLKESAGA